MALPVLQTLTDEPLTGTKAVVPNSFGDSTELLFLHNPDAVFACDLAGRFLRVNNACETFFGYTTAEMLTLSLLPLVVPEDEEQAAEHLRLAAQGLPEMFEAAFMHKAGHSVFLSLTVLPLSPSLTAQNEAPILYGIAKNISARKQWESALQESEQRLRQSEERLRLALESGSFGTFDLDLTTGKYLDLSPLWRAQYGVPLDKKEVTRDEWLCIIHPEDRERTQQASQRAVEDRHEYTAEYRIVWPDGAVHWSSAHGTPFYSASGEPVRLVGVTQNTTERKAQEARQEQALHEAEDRADRDPLTGLWNHRAFYRRLQEEAVRTQRSGSHLAVVMLDLNHFGFFNNCYGHVVGDAVLRQVAELMLGVCRSYDTCARFGGDEFSLLLSGIGQASATEIETRLRHAFSGLTFQPDGAETAIPITLSLGAAVFSGGKQNSLDAVKSADARLRRAKTGGGSDTEADQVRTAVLAQIADFSMLDALVTAVDNKDRYTRQHSEDVMACSLMIAREMKLAEDVIHTVAVAALLHDLGKIGVSDAILRKPGKLTEEEFEAVKRHPQTGAVIVAAVPGLEETLAAVRHHHERWDGGGYPAGLQGKETPLIARLMAVADAFSAMTTDRPYRTGMDREQALSLLESGSGSQWDPACIAAFLSAMRQAERLFPAVAAL